MDVRKLDKTVRALVSTIEPIDGGVPSMTRWVCKMLEEWNITPILAWYAPWSRYPKLSVPSYKVLSRSPAVIQQLDIDNYRSYGLGSWFPELEFTHYLPNKHWRSLINSCDLHITVSGNPLAATPYVLMDLPFIAWIATPWAADRVNRIKDFSISRRTLDRFINSAVLARLEKKVLRYQNGAILSLSKYTSEQFREISGAKNASDSIMIMPVNRCIFFREQTKTIKWRIGFSGRYSDPRKNIILLLNAINSLARSGFPIELVLVGDRNKDIVAPYIYDLDLVEKVTCHPHMIPTELADTLKTLDVFVIPSYQEGLCIAALEAMACGVPVVSTRCGGPEDYVEPDKTGILVDFNAEALAEAIRKVCSNREYRDKLSINASKWVEHHASEERSREVFGNRLLKLIEHRGLQSSALEKVPRISSS